MKNRLKPKLLSGEEFKELTLKHLAFLQNEFGFVLNVEEKPYLGTYLLFQNKTTAIKVECEPSDRGVFVLVMRLNNGVLPLYPKFDNPNEVINTFYLEDIVNIVRGNREKIVSSTSPKNEVSLIEHQLSEVAAQLRSETANVLEGDFHIFPELEKLVKMRAKIIQTMD
jgi:hypothetical protein